MASRPLALEQLEDRSVPTLDITFAAGILTITDSVGPGFDDVVTGEATGTAITFQTVAGNPFQDLTSAAVPSLMLSGGNTTLDFDTADVTAVVVDLAGGNDDFTLNSATPFPDPLTLIGGVGSNRLTGPDAGAFFDVTASDAGDIGGAGVVDFSDFQDLFGGTGADQFRVGATGSLSGSIQSLGGNDDISVDAGASVTGFIDAGDGADIVTISSTVLGGVFGSSGNDQIALNAGASVMGDVNGDAGIDQISVLGAATADLFGGDGDDRFEIDAVLTGSILGGDNPTMGGPDGNDTIVFGNPGSITGSLEGDIGVDTIIGDDDGNSFALTGTDAGLLIGKIGMGFTNVENLIGDNGGGIDDLFLFTPGGSLSGSIDGAAGLENELSYNSFGAPATVNLETATATGLGGNFTNIGRLTGSLTTDFLIGPNAATTYELNGVDAGAVITPGGPIFFTQFENVTGGAGDDRFVNVPAGPFGVTGASGGVESESAEDGRVDAAGTVSGLVDGAGGVDTLDYRLHVVAITVDLSMGSAAGYGSVANFENVVGGAASDMLTGDSNANRLEGGPGADTLTGGAGNDIYAFNIDFGLDTVVEEIGGGIDTLDLSGVSIPIVLDLSGDIPDGTTSGFTFDTDGFEIIILGSGDDTVVFLDNGDLGGGATNLDGGPGFDTLNYFGSILTGEADLTTGIVPGVGVAINFERIGGVNGTTIIETLDTVQAAATTRSRERQFTAGASSTESENGLDDFIVK